MDAKAGGVRKFIDSESRQMTDLPTALSTTEQHANTLSSTAPHRGNTRVPSTTSWDPQPTRTHNEHFSKAAEKRHLVDEPQTTTYSNFGFVPFHVKSLGVYSSVRTCFNGANWPVPMISKESSSSNHHFSERQRPVPSRGRALAADLALAPYLTRPRRFSIAWPGASTAGGRKSLSGNAPFSSAGAVQGLSISFALDTATPAAKSVANVGTETASPIETGADLGTARFWGARAAIPRSDVSDCGYRMGGLVRDRCRKCLGSGSLLGRRCQGDVI